MDRKYLIIAAVALALAFAAGRYMTPEKIKEVEKTVYVEKKDTTKKTDTERNRNKHTTTVEETRPDGTKIVKTITDETTDTKRITDTTERTETSLETERSKLIEMGRNRVTVSVLGGLDVTDLKKPPVYGAHVSKPFFGPITLGIWGLTNSTGGVSLGLQF